MKRILAGVLAATVFLTSFDVSGISVRAAENIVVTEGATLGDDSGADSSVEESAASGNSDNSSELAASNDDSDTSDSDASASETSIGEAGDENSAEASENYDDNSKLVGASGYLSGEGSEDNPYKIGSAKDLENLRKHFEEDVSGCYIKITNDFTVNDDISNPKTKLKPIPSNNDVRIDGGRHTISGLYIEGEDNASLFMGAREIKDLIIEDAVINVQDSEAGTSSYSNISVICNNVQKPVSNCKLKGNITINYDGTKSSCDIGGLFCSANVVSDCSMQGNLVVNSTSYSNVAGIVYSLNAGGYNTHEIYDCEMTGNITVNGNAQVAGVAINAMNIHNCISGDENEVKECRITATSDKNTYVSGIAYNATTCTNCRNYATLDSRAHAVGIIWGDEGGGIKNCENYGTILTAQLRAGIAFRGNITNCTNYADITEEEDDEVNNEIYGIAPYFEGSSFYYNENYGNLSGGKVCGIVGEVSLPYNGSSDVTISDCTNYGALSGTQVSGIADELASRSEYNAIITNCVNEGAISGSEISGIVREVWYGGKVSSCFNLAELSGRGIGGIAHTVYSGGEISNCTNNGQLVTAQDYSNAGGIVNALKDHYAHSDMPPVISNNSNTGKISGFDSMGGIVFSMESGIIRECCNSGEIITEYENGHAGGVVCIARVPKESNNSMITDCYNSGSITATNIGGLIYDLSNDNYQGSFYISNCYNIGTLTRNSNRGGAYHIICSRPYENMDGITISSCYYPSTGNDGIPTEDGESVSGITCCTDQEMKTQSTYKGWDFDSTWMMGTESYKYPVLTNSGEKKYTITFDPQGGTLDTTTVVTSSRGKLSSLPRPKYEGKRFGGWYTLPEGGDCITTSTVFTGNTTIYAQWKDFDPADRVKVKPVSPEHKVKDFRYIDDGGWVNFEISFTTDVPVKAIDVKKGKLRLVEYSTDTVIYETESSNTVKVKPNGTGSKVYFSFFNSGIKPATNYYIEIEDGFMSFEDDSKFAYVDKDEWIFMTRYNHRITIRNEAEGIKKDVELNYDFYYEDSLFEDSASKFDKQRTIWAFGLAMAGFESYEGGYSNGSKNAQRMMEQFGFKTDPQLSPNADYKAKPTENSFGVCVGDKRIADKNGKVYTLLAVATRGAGYEAEWYSNGLVGAETEHEGFYAASEKVLSQIASYIKNRQITGDIKIVMAGYSRAAATTNIAAARINDGELATKLAGTDVSITQDNVYAYCFECPATTKKAYESGSSADAVLQKNYTNISNIINPSDFIPFVPLDGEGWGYKRYGIDYYLPNELLNSNGYGEYRGKFLNKYRQFGLNYDYSSFDYYEVVWSDYTIDNVKSLIGRKLDKVKTRVKTSNMPLYMFNIKFRTELKQAVPSCWQYEAYLQKQICPCLREAFTGGNPPWEKIAENCDFIVDQSGSILYSDILDCVMTLYKNIKSYKLGLLFQQHEPLLNFAMLVSLEGNLELKELHNESESFHVLYINCPVDVSVYNSSGELVAQIVDDKAVSIDGSFIGSFVDENGQKVIVLPRDDDFRISLSGTDEGTMDYVISEYSITGQEYVKKTIYCNIPVYEGVELTATVDDSGVNTLKNQDLVTLSPSKEYDGIVPDYNVTVINDGAGYVQGAGKISAGEHVLLTAEPNFGAEFEGWYDTNGTLVSKEQEFRFRVDSDMQFTAKFKERDGLTAVVEEEMTYTGAALKPAVRVYDGVTELTAGTDYTISYKNNKNAYTYTEEDAEFNASKAPTVIVTGKGNYSGKETAYFVINPKPLTDEDITVAAVADIKEDGKVKKPLPVITQGKKKLKANTDFTVTYHKPGGEETECKDVGDYIARITGKGNYTGIVESSFAIYAKERVPISKAKLYKIPDSEYDGNPRDISEDVMLSYNKTILTEGTDYRIDYNDDRTSVGKKSITIVGLGDYAGARSAIYNITGVSLKKATITNFQAAVEYTGDAAYQSAVLTLNGKELTAGTSANDKTADYVVTYSGNLNAGTAKVTYTGINSYTGSLQKTFKITKKVLNKTDFELVVPATTPFVKGGSTPEVTLKFKGTDLALGKDFTVSYKNNKALTTAATKAKPQVIVTGKGNFQGKLTAEFEIIPRDISSVDSGVTMFAKDVVASDKAGKWKSKPVLTDSDGKALKAGTDYDKQITYYVSGSSEPLSDTAVVDAGTTIKAVANGIGAYSGSIETTYRVVMKDISKASAKVAAKAYPGKGKKVTLSYEDITLSYQKEPLEKDVDYVIDDTTYKNNGKKGKATVVIRGKGDFGGSKTVSFTIGAKGIVWWFRNLFQ
ncbi:InlB B-repeat-containing protein [Butyrivibrio sp. MC2021]|uniref:InlB B-repeat-containing protein n=1 Tax=Butyrivibrio sp. MC2021 TaxID=1408306 RepID=UPI00047AFE39|nr:InlB B-repeat-containing protein [Butyrivibrio sp. MC2021]